MGVWGHSKAVEDPLGSSQVKVEEGCTKAERSKRHRGGMCALGIKAASYISVYFRNNGVILFLAQILHCYNSTEIPLT